MTFWSSNRVDPKRGFRFLMELTPKAGDKIATYNVKTAKKPTFQMDGQGEVKYIQHTFKYPGRITWQPIEITVIDPSDPDSQAILYNIMSDAGYNVPWDETVSGVSMSKKKSMDAIGTLKIREIDAEGADISIWTLHNPFLTTVDFGQLSYDSDEILEYVLTVDYDFATLWAAATAVHEDVLSKSTGANLPNFD